MPKEASLALLLLSRLLRRQKHNARIPKTIPAAATLPTVTPAISGLVRTGRDPDAAAAAVTVGEVCELVGNDVIGTKVEVSVKLSSVVEGKLEVVLDSVGIMLVSATISEGNIPSLVAEGGIEGNDGSGAVSASDIVLVRGFE